MKGRIVLLILLVMVLVSVTTHAAARDTIKNGLVEVWDLNGDIDGKHNAYNCANFSATRQLSGGPSSNLPGYYDFDGVAGTHLNCTQNSGLRTTTMTMSMWVNPDTAGFTSYVAGYYYGGDVLQAPWGGYHLTGNAGGAFIWTGNVGGALKTANSPNGYQQAGEWSHVVIIYDGDDNYIYVNGSLAQQVEQTDGTVSYVAPFDAFTIGSRSSSFTGSEYDGKISQVAVWSSNKTLEEVEFLYNNGMGNPYSNWTAPTQVSNFTIGAFDNSTGLEIKVFNASMSNSTVTWNFTTTTGIITTNVTNISSSFYNITLSSVNYSSLNYVNYNVSTNLNGSMAPYFKITATDESTSATINTFNATVNGTLYTTTTGTVVTTIPFNVSTTVLIEVGAENYTNKTWTSYNVSTDLAAQLRYFYYASVDYTSTILELTEQTMTLIINTSSQVTATAAGLTYNGNATTVVKTINANYTNYTATFVTPSVPSSSNITFTWNYNITRASEVTQVNFTANQTVIIIGIDNCSTYTVRAINFSIRNETDEALIQGSIDGYFQVYISAENQFRDFNLTWDSASQYGLCIAPGNASYLINAQLEYIDTNQTLDTKNYYFTNATLTNNTQSINLYLTGSTTQVKFSVSDENDNVVPNVYINVLTYDLGTDSYRTTEILRTDSNGDAWGEIILNTQWYKFLLEYNNAVVLETDPTKIDTTSKNFRINFVQDYFINYNSVQGVTCSLSYTNATRNFALVFDDPSGLIAQACLNVVKRQINFETEINDTCLSSTSGMILTNIGADVGATYFANARVVVGSETFSCGETVEFNEDTSYLAWGDEGRFMSILLQITMVGIGIWNPFVALILLTITMTLSVVMGIFHLSYGMLVGFVILMIIAMYRLKE